MPMHVLQNAFAWYVSYLAYAVMCVCVFVVCKLQSLEMLFLSPDQYGLHTLHWCRLQIESKGHTFLHQHSGHRIIASRWTVTVLY